MIRIGLSDSAKRETVQRYIRDHGITRVYAFSWEGFPISYEIDVPIEYYGYKDIIEYKPFYHLLEVIDNRSLLVFNECLRTQNRSDLTYNCAHHYCNQTPHKIVFETFPFIEEPNDFMILLDLLDKGRYRGQTFSPELLSDVDYGGERWEFTVETILTEISEKDMRNYDKKKSQLFESLGNGDPDTVPRHLHVFVGNLKKSSIDPGRKYVARNDRFKLPNVTTYKNVERQEYIIIDFPHRRLDFNDFLKKSGTREIRFISTGLKVDLYYLRDLCEWIGRLEEFYAQTGIRK